MPPPWFYGRGRGGGGGARGRGRAVQGAAVVYPPPPPAPRLPADPRMLLEKPTAEQEAALLALYLGENMYLAGEAGTGKTATLRHGLATLRAQDRDPSATFITAMTGIAATLLGDDVEAKTFHKFLGAGLAREPFVEWLRTAPRAAVGAATARMRHCKRVFIDEISMMSGTLLEFFDELARHARCSSAPFGGIQVIVVGDFMQLPPVEDGAARAATAAAFVAGAAGVTAEAYLFQHRLWCFRAYPLTARFRQSADPGWGTALSHFRTSEPTQDDIDALAERVVDTRTVPRTVPRLFPHRATVAEYNGVCMAELPADDGHTFRKRTAGPAPRLFADIEDSIEVRKGARVMLTANLRTEAGLVNGRLGTVLEVTSGGVVISFDGLGVRRIRMRAVERRAGTRGRPTTCEYMPLQLAFALTMHKCQGQSLEAAVIDLSGRAAGGRGCFAPGQAYTALSRVKRISGVYLTAFSPSAVFSSSVVAEWEAAGYPIGGSRARARKRAREDAPVAAAAAAAGGEGVGPTEVEVAAAAREDEEAFEAAAIAMMMGTVPPPARKHARRGV